MLPPMPDFQLQPTVSAASSFLSEHGKVINTGDGPAVTLAVVGDVHDLWDGQEEAILQRLGVDLVLFVGDFGNESVEVVRRIASLKLPKAVVMGNHDAWYTATPWGRTNCPYDRKQEDWVQQQLEVLGKTHVGYSWLDFPAFDLTVVGSRPFSWGGSEWKYKRFYRDRFQVRNFRESVQRIMSAVEAAAHRTIIFLGHCGPHGLGDYPEDTCGKDWGRGGLGGDYGDPDFADAIAQTQLMGKNVPLVTFGHMHHSLRHRQDRERTKVNQVGKTLYLNAACVPRIRDYEGDRIYGFSLVRLDKGQVQSSQLVWADRAGAVIHSEVLSKLADASYSDRQIG